MSSRSFHAYWSPSLIIISCKKKLWLVSYALATSFIFYPSSLKLATFTSQIDLSLNCENRQKVKLCLESYLMWVQCHFECRLLEKLILLVTKTPVLRNTVPGPPTGTLPDQSPSTTEPNALKTAIRVLLEPWLASLTFRRQLLMPRCISVCSQQWSRSPLYFYVVQRGTVGDTNNLCSSWLKSVLFCISFLLCATCLHYSPYLLLSLLFYGFKDT